MAEKKYGKIDAPKPPTAPKPKPLSPPLPGLRESEDIYIPEHPDDTASRHESMREAYASIDGFAERKVAELAELIWTYGDGEAQRKLEALREEFWSTTPPGNAAEWKRVTGHGR